MHFGRLFTVYSKGYSFCDFVFLFLHSSLNKRTHSGHFENRITALDGAKGRIDQKYEKY